MTKNEEELVASLNADIQMWEAMGQYLNNATEISCSMAARFPAKNMPSSFQIEFNNTAI